MVILSKEYKDNLCNKIIMEDAEPVSQGKLRIKNYIEYNFACLKRKLIIKLQEYVENKSDDERFSKINKMLELLESVYELNEESKDFINETKKIFKNEDTAGIVVYIFNQYKRKINEYSNISTLINDILNYIDLNTDHNELMKKIEYYHTQFHR
jgi:hypothetical protein